ncbi:4-vinyl reductase 4VR [Methanocaldococcus infernus ME]|uniref:4-vinyl reductase 4VR n=1 Tax=Methanocaldococcus infernus (strain DSM 11812 / JCM 15783 / ME) TaxID=573063 RepID=D5VR24_METIM|nr:V4R domain-containing protein [Methanocaldococcus infernus]ADG13027.1 4-vinyl reductase 4VR [Methanocaldococcus infernus ME]
MKLILTAETAKQLSKTEESKEIPDDEKLIKKSIELLLKGESKKKVPVEFFKVMVYIAIKKMLEYGNAITFYEIGYEFGKHLDIKDLNDLKEFFEKANLGELEVVSEDPLILKVNNCTLCSNLEFDEPICYLDAGILAGALENILNSVVVVDEFECMATGGDACYFKVEVVKD